MSRKCENIIATAVATGVIPAVLVAAATYAAGLESAVTKIRIGCLSK